LERFERLKRLEPFGLIAVQRLMLSSNPRVGEMKLEDIVDRSIMRKLDDSGFIDRLYSAYPARRSWRGVGRPTKSARPMNRLLI